VLDQRGRLLPAALDVSLAGRCSVLWRPSVRLPSLIIALAALAFSPLVYGQSRTSVSPDLIKTMLVSHKHWIFYWDRGDLARPRVGATTSARSPSATIEFTRVGIQLVGYYANDQVHHAECEFEVTVRDNGFVFTGCWGSEISMTYDPADHEYPFKGRVDGTSLWLAPFR
jgi:hypothetical protein